MTRFVVSVVSRVASHRVALGGLVAVVAVIGLAAGAPEAGDGDGRAELTRGQALFADAKYREAVKNFLRARELDASLAVPVTRSVVRALLRVGDFSLAEREASTLPASADDASEASDLALHGETLWSIGHFEEAETRFAASLVGEPENTGALHGMSRVLDARGRSEEALALVERAIEQAPDIPEYHHTRAYLLERLRNYPMAAAELERYISLLPPKGFKDQRKLARAKIKFLRHFGTRTPLAMTDEVLDQVHVVPFRVEREKLLIRAKVNGRLNRDVVIDTGAEMMVLSEDAARRAGVYSVAETLSAGVGDVGLRRLKLARVTSLEIGTLRVEHVPAMIKDPPLRRMPSAEIDAISPLALGLSMHVDYEKQQLIMARDLPPVIGMPAMEAPFWMHRLATVRGRLNGNRPAAFVVDTGGQAISISRSAAVGLEQLGRFRRIPLKVFGSSGWDRDAFLLPGVDLEVDEVRMAQASLVVLNLRAPSVLLGYEVGGILGHKFLSRYRLTLDLDSGMMRLDD